MNFAFDTSVQELKYKVLREIARGLFEDNLLDEYNNIPLKISPGPKSTMRCCIYKERAIVLERMKLALGGNKNINNIIEVINIACDECPLGGYEVTNRCRGCIAHRCEKACRKQAITFDPTTRTAKINKESCVNCGMCANACQYNAIVNFLRPCEQACKVKAISMGEDKAAKINDEKCVQCGACVYQCPFGAIMDKSFIREAIDILKAPKDENHPVYAIVAPSIASQFRGISLGKIISAIKELGFTHVVEAALGADMVSYSEAEELAKKGFLTSSCCPSFVSYIKKYFPTLEENISHNLSPMATIGKWIKDHNKDAKLMFIGPCVAKKKEIQDERVKNIIDVTLTFEELQAMIDAKNIDIENLEESTLDEASYFGRIFGRGGGLAEAVQQALKEQDSNFVLKATSADGLENCRLALLKAKSGNCDFNFIEGMGCIGGCVGGPCALTHDLRSKVELNKHSQQSTHQTITEAIKNYK